MGNQKQKWTAEEEEALLAGVAKHGPGKWKNILKDPEFAPFLTQRSNIDLKDKWRNLSVSTAQQGSKDKSRVSKVKTAVAGLLSTPNSAPAASLARNVSSDTVTGDRSNTAWDVKNGPRYNAMIFEAISTIKDTNGSDISSIVNYIEAIPFNSWASFDAALEACKWCRPNPSRDRDKKHCVFAGSACLALTMIIYRIT
ncbi:hypothetical protein JRO89_XS09G0222100 [Xanthoceras sorbifolium]|uniref:MYB transcription factor n=1 Tax=Xanthoceras sorbifolium TaxID=99658 RepID=A0ABQ8HME1_9ROSI|nr:hypothetical protein JRO89_XS09G0222100 [Xanthoceras sorbifolium]